MEFQAPDWWVCPCWLSHMFGEQVRRWKISPEVFSQKGLSSPSLLPCLLLPSRLYIYFFQKGLFLFERERYRERTQRSSICRFTPCMAVTARGMAG